MLTSINRPYYIILYTHNRCFNAVRRAVCASETDRRCCYNGYADGWAQYGIDLPGSLHTNKIPVIMGRYPLLGFFCRLNIVPLDRDNGIFNSSNTDVVKKVNFFVAASQHAYFGGGRIPTARGQKWLCFGNLSRGDPFLWIFSKTKF